MDNDIVSYLREYKSQYKVPNLDRGLNVLELLSHYTDGLTLTEIGQLLELPKNSCYRISMALHVRGFLKRDEQTKKFTLSDKLLGLGCSKTGEASLIEKSWDVMRRIRDLTGETVLIGTIVEHKGVVLEQILSKHAFKFQIGVGTRFDLHASALGMAMLAFLPDDECTEILSAIKLKKYTDTTITGRKELRVEMAQVNERGYSIDHAAMIEGCQCVGVPIFNRHNYPIASIWATGPANRLTLQKIEEYGPQMVKMVAEITHSL